MRKMELLFGAAILFATSVGNCAPTVDVFQKEYQRAIQAVVENMQANGAVVASPSQSDPNYYYNWIRDTALTMKAVVTLAYDPKSPSSLKTTLVPRIDRWIKWELHLQVVPKITDLGEPRFNVDGTANNDPWNRPQNDGPALRAQTAILVANEWLNEGRLDDVSSLLYKSELPAATLIKRDLEYVSHHWMDQSFDLWEEEKGMHFYTLTQQKVALLKGAELAQRLGDGGGASYYAKQANEIERYMLQFFDTETGTLRYALDLGNRLPQKTTNLDISIILAAIESYDGQFYVPVEQVKNTIPALVAQFQNEYAINKMKHAPTGKLIGTALGRYPGDRYSGTGFSVASPWFLSTLALAEFYCEVDNVKNHDLAMAQFELVFEHMGAGGELSEQFNRDSGYEQGARDLTWSYTAYITAYRACFLK